MAVSRQREYLADATSVQFTRNPNGLISALQKLADKAAPFPGVSRATQHLFIVNPVQTFTAKRPALLATHVFSSTYEWNDADWLAPRAAEAAAPGADERLRGAPRLVAARPVLPRAGRPAHRVRRRAGLHPRRVHAGDGAPVRRLLGLPGHRLLRADLPLRRPRRVPPPGRHAAPGRHRRDPRLGARALPQGRVGAGPLRRHPALRARRPAARRAPRLGHVRLRLRPHARCATSWSPTRSTGATSSTSTACGSTRSPRCSTWTTRARTASGRRTSTAAGRTWRRSASCRR